MTVAENNADQAETPVPQKPLRAYAPRPFESASWEIVSESEGGECFLPLVPDVVANENEFVDPLFESFDTTPRKSSVAKQVVTGPAHVATPELDQEALEEKLEARFQAGKERGIEEGKALGKAENEKQLKDMQTKLNEFVANVQAEHQRFFEQTEKEAVRLALQVARKILSCTAQVKPDYIIDVVKAGMKSLGASKPLRVRVSHEDMEFIQVIGLPAELSTEELGVEYVADESIKSGCVIDTDFGEIDLQLDNMWEQISEQLSEVYK